MDIGQLRHSLVNVTAITCAARSVTNHENVVSEKLETLCYSATKNRASLVSDSVRNTI